MAKHDHQGHSKKGGQFVLLYEFMQQTAAWRACSPVDRVIYIELVRTYNGSNNGRLAKGVRELGELANVNKDTAGKALKRLAERGLIECTTPGGFSLKLPHTAEWRLTQYRCDRTGQLASKAFMKWRPEMQNAVRKQGTTRPKAGDKSPVEPAVCPKAGDNITPFEPPTGPLVSDTYISGHRQGVANG